MSDTVASRTGEGWSTTTALRLDIEDFLIYEADLLDRWRLIEWFGLFTDEGMYVIPATDYREPDLTRDLTIIQDDYFLLEQRVNSLLTRTAHSEYPHSRTRRLVTNVRAQEQDDGTIKVRANFAVYRLRLENMDTYVGSYQHHLEPGGDAGYRFRERRTLIDLESLRPHGKVSIIL